MKAIWRGNLWAVGDTDTPGHPGTVELTTLTRITVTKYARLGDPGLILDPTDDEIAPYCRECGSPVEECGGNHDDRDERDHACPNCGGETDQPGRLCAVCEHAEDDARDADDSERREYYGEGED